MFKNILKPIMLSSIVILVLGIYNLYNNIISIPKFDIVVSRAIDFITISTVFAGFSFTALGLLLGLSSEKLIERIKNTSIVINKVNRILISIIFFVICVGISLSFVIFIDTNLFTTEKYLTNFSIILYFMCIGYLICGIIYFIYSVYELYDLIKRVYIFNNTLNKKDIDNFTNAMESTRSKMRT